MLDDVDSTLLLASAWHQDEGVGLLHVEKYSPVSVTETLRLEQRYKDTRK